MDAWGELVSELAGFYEEDLSLVLSGKRLMSKA